MEAVEIMSVSAGILGTGTIIFKWLKKAVDELKQDQVALRLHLAEDFSTSEHTLQTIGLINAPVQQSIEALKMEMHSVKTHVTGVEDKIDQVLMNQSKRTHD